MPWLLLRQPSLAVAWRVVAYAVSLCTHVGPVFDALKALQRYLTFYVMETAL